MNALAMRVLSERYACIDVVLQSTAIVVRRLGFICFLFLFFFFYFFVAAERGPFFQLLLRIGMNDLVDRSLSYLVRIRFPCFVLPSPHALAISSFLSPCVEVCVEALRRSSALLGTEVAVC